MNVPAIKVVTADEKAEAVGAIVLSFTADPAARWTWPNAAQFMAAMPRMVEGFGGKAFARGTAFGSGAGAALWLPPGIGPDEEALGAVMQSSLSPARFEHVMRVFGQMAKYHPQEPHWYLPLIGVDPAHQGQGHGDALMRHALAQCDDDRAPAYLESSNPRNLPFYRRYGFEQLGTIQIDDSPPIVPMLRPARR